MRAFFILILTGIVISILLINMHNILDPNIVSDDAPKRLSRNANECIKMNEKLEKIFWIVQISDLHISKFRDFGRGSDLIRFCEDTLSLINPSLVLITGDLTDAKAANDVTSKQFEEEWKIYRQVIDYCQAQIPVTFLDIRGNHDAFDVPEMHGESNMYRQYSMMGRQHASSYRYEHVEPFGRYSFIAVDACPTPGPRRPFNFFGYLDDDRFHQLVGLNLASKGDNLTFWFGHYPSSLIVQDPPGLQHVMRNGIAYLCGHLHTLGGFLPRLYSRQKTGTLELELGDWKDNRMYRLLAVDHDLLSFVDAKLGLRTLVLVTNPKNAQFIAKFHEPVECIKHSSHIRMLVFSPVRILTVEVYIDDRYIGRASSDLSNLAFYTLAWEPSELPAGLCTLLVVVKDDLDISTSFEQQFSVDGSSVDFALRPRFILMLNLANVAKMTFYWIAFCYVLFLATMRQSLFSTVMLMDRYSSCQFAARWLRRVWLVAHTNIIYYTLLGFLFYIMFGPWLVGELLTGHMGIIFLWGTFVKGTFMPGSLSYIYGISQIVTFHVPLTLILGAKLDRHHHHSMSSCLTYAVNIFYLLLLLIHLYVAVTDFPRNYGMTSMLINPVRGGSVLVGALLFLCANR